MSAVDSIKKWKDGLLIVLFAAMLWAPAADSVFHFSKASLNEFREGAEKPPWPASWWEWRRYPSKYQQYFDDNFGLRSPLVRINSRLALRGFSQNQRVIAGRDRWLFLRHAEGGDILGLFPLEKENLEYIHRSLELKQLWLSMYNRHYLYAIAPNKTTMYPEYLPFKTGTAYTRFRQIVETLDINGYTNYLDLSMPLRAAREKDELLYIPNDTHWNALGAYVAYAEIMRKFQEWYPQLNPIPLDEFRRDTSHAVPGDLQRMLGLADEKDLYAQRTSLVLDRTSKIRGVGYYKPDGTYVRAPVSSYAEIMDRARRWRYCVLEGDRSGPRLLLFRDSFSNFIIPFLGEHFSEITICWEHPRAGSFKNWVHRSQPDIVLELFVEREADKVYSKSKH